MSTRKASPELQAPGFEEEDGAEQVLATDWDSSLFNESFSEMLNGFSLPENSHILAASRPTNPRPSNENGNTNQRKRKASHAGDKFEWQDASSDTAKRVKDDKEEKGALLHLRAKRGQATSSHSLAERVRRERISERMKFLQDLVPGCNKITGKAFMLDEIINYVRSLQLQVEFLAMKLASVDPDLNMDMDQIPPREILLSRCQIQTIPWCNAEINPSNAELNQPGVAIPITTDQGELLRTNLYQTPNKSQISNLSNADLQKVIQMDLFSYPFRSN